MITAESHFKQTFKESPTHQVLSPGRVNLIGEHTDYNLLPVLPMTISQSIKFTLRPRKDCIIRLVNLNDNFPAIEIDFTVPIQPAPGHWANYCRAAIHHVLQHHPLSELNGFDAVLESDLPPAAGLSSSSALVIGTCLSLLAASNITWPAKLLADRMRSAEQFVGTAGGGMDQAIISLGEPDSALLIEFDPLTTNPAPLPPDIDIYILNSGQKAEKTGAARFHYNRRSLECALGVAILDMNRPENQAPWQSLRDIYQYCTGKNLSFDHVIAQIPSAEKSTPVDIISLIGQDTFEVICHRKKLNPKEINNWLPDGQLKIAPRVEHVLNEAARVYQFHKALLDKDIQTIHKLVTLSHNSLHQLYEITTPEINQLVALATESGASSARITGAGFGGSIVALVPEEQSVKFKSNLHLFNFPEDKLIKAKSLGPARIAVL